jgi:hypothetical protein
MTKEEVLEFVTKNPMFSLATTWSMTTAFEPKQYIEL